MSERDNYQKAAKAEARAKAQVGVTAGYEDLANFRVITYTAKELKEYGDEGGWVGQYLKGSVDSSDGTAVLLNLSAHATEREMADTIRHELGHALWELVDRKGRRAWSGKVSGGKWGPEEAFADDFMYLTGGSSHLMSNERLFLKITAQK